MEYNKTTNKSVSTSIPLCIFFIFGMFLFSFIFIELDFLFPRKFPMIIFLPIIFIGIFIPISTVFRVNKQHKISSQPTYAKQSQNPVVVQNEYYSKEISLKPLKIQDYYCKYCGEKIARDSVYCPQCGTRLKN